MTRTGVGVSHESNRRSGDVCTDNLRGGIIAGIRRDHNDYLFAGCFHHRRGSLVRKIRRTNGLNGVAGGVASDVREARYVVLGVVKHLGPLGARSSPALRQTGNGFRERQRYRSAAAVLCLPHLRLIDDHGDRTVDDEGVAVADGAVARRVCEDRDERVLAVGQRVPERLVRTIAGVEVLVIAVQRPHQVLGSDCIDVHSLQCAYLVGDGAHVVAVTDGVKRQRL